MLIADEPSSESDEDSMPSLISGEGYNMADVEPYVHKDQECRWTDLVVAEVATYFYGDMAVVLGMWASAVYSQNSLLGIGNNFDADCLFCGMIFPV